jgi:Kyakuja-Dileera-Zisupton transposase
MAGKYGPPKSQRNMDYSIFKALNFNMDGIEAALISYDVMCQWSVHMKERVIGSDYLKLRNDLELRLAIGLFHIHGHQDTCLARYSPTFIEGGRQIDGETIETLWAPLNEISRSTRGMSTSHRREVIDDHMNDSNWKKLVDLGKFPPKYTISFLTGHVVSAVSKRYKKALLGTTLSATAFESINSSATPESIQTWSAEEEHAQTERVHDITAMDIYDIKMKRREPNHSTPVLVPDFRFQSRPVRKYSSS